MCNKTLTRKGKAKIRFDENINENRLQYNIGDKVYAKESQIKDKFQIKGIYQNLALLHNLQHNN